MARPRSSSTTSLPDAKLDRCKLMKKRKTCDNDNDNGNSQADNLLIQRIQSERESLEDYLFTDTNKVSKSMSKFVLAKWSTLERQLYEQFVEAQKWKSAYEAIKGATMQPKQTYAEKVMVKAPTVPKELIKSPKTIVTVFPAEGTKITNSEQTKEIVMGSFKPVTDKLRIRNLRKIRNNGVLIETEGRNDLMQILQSKKLEEAGLKASLPSKKQPRIIIFDVPREYCENTLTEAIHLQNAEGINKQKLDNEFKLIFKTGNKLKETVNWVAEVSPDLRKLLTAKGRVFVGWRACKIQDFIRLTRCYKCQSFGHVAKFCKAETETCGHCGVDGHNFKNCPNKSKKESCALCKRIKKPDCHSSRSNDCPIYKLALAQHINKIDYG